MWVDGILVDKNAVVPLTILTTQIAKFMGPTWGPPGSCWPQMGPMLVQWTLLSGKRLRSILTRLIISGQNCVHWWTGIFADMSKPLVLSIHEVGTWIVNTSTKNCLGIICRETLGTLYLFLQGCHIYILPVTTFCHYTFWSRLLWKNYTLVQKRVL